MIRPVLVLLCSLALPSLLAAQHAGAPPSRVAPPEARQFDFLIGQWELTVKPKATSLAARIHGAPRLVGTWKAWRALDGWGVEDELRIMDRSGNPMALVQSLRGYDATGHRWLLTGFDAYRGRVTTATAEWSGREMVTSGRNADPEGPSYLTRTRFTKIGADAFTLHQDRSEDGGRTWDEDLLVIQAKRVATEAPR
jgi:hypothetical protein